MHVHKNRSKTDCVIAKVAGLGKVDLLQIFGKFAPPIFTIDCLDCLNYLDCLDWLDCLVNLDGNKTTAIILH